MFSRKRFCSAGESEWHISGENDLSIKKMIFCVKTYQWFPANLKRFMGAAKSMIDIKFVIYFERSI